MKRTPLQRKTQLTSGGPRRKRCPECRVMFTKTRESQVVCGEIECAIAHGKSEKGRAIAGKALADVGRREIKVRKEKLKTRADHLREAQAASAIGHEHIVRVDDFGVDADSGPFLVMELLRVRALSEEIAAHAPMPWPRVTKDGATKNAMTKDITASRTHCCLTRRTAAAQARTTSAAMTI